jgi:hypothetical protein
VIEFGSPFQESVIPPGMEDAIEFDDSVIAPVPLVKDLSKYEKLIIYHYASTTEEADEEDADDSDVGIGG